MNLFFDLDGTLTDSKPGIINSFHHTLRAMGRPAPDAAALMPLIGPPLRDGLADLLETRDPDVLETAVAHYREYFSASGMYENSVYPGIRSLLEGLRAAGARMWVITGKTDYFARKIVSHFDLLPFFNGITGSAADGSVSSKTEMVAGVLSNEGLDAARTVMIGDRKHDIIGARENGIAAVGVLWGYGSAEELTAAGAHVLSAAPKDLTDAIAAALDMI